MDRLICHQDEFSGLYQMNAGVIHQDRKLSVWEDHEFDFEHECVFGNNIPGTDVLQEIECIDLEVRRNHLCLGSS